jgi:tubulin-specific chaperone D
MSSSVFDCITDALFYGMEDYSTDTRGDVGSWVREACFKAWTVIIPSFSVFESGKTKSERLMTPSLTRRAICGLTRQSLEKIDRVRESAGKALLEIVFCSSVEDLGFSAPSTGFLKSVLDTSEDINWLNAAAVYPRLVSLLKIPELRTDVFLGLIVSVGGISESLVRT